MLLSTFRIGMQTRTLARQICTAEPLRPMSVTRPTHRQITFSRRLLSVRASKGGRPDSESDKSWGEIIQDATGVAKSVFDKIKDTATSLLPSAPSSSAKPAPRPKPDAPLEPSSGAGGGLLPSLLGRAVGSLLGSAISSLSAQLEEAARQQEGVYEEAVDRLQASDKLRARLGAVTVGPVMSQSSSSSSINGRVSKEVALVMPVYGSLGGGGTATACVTEGPSGRSMQISVRTSDGGYVVVDDDGAGSGGPGGWGSGGNGGRGRVIDVEFKEVKK